MQCGETDEARRAVNGVAFKSGDNYQVKMTGDGSGQSTPLEISDGRYTADKQAKLIASISASSRHSITVPTGSLSETCRSGYAQTKMSPREIRSVNPS